MEKVIMIDGVQYIARRRTNLNEANTRFFKRMIALSYTAMAIRLGIDAEQIAVVLLDYAHISGQVTGGSALLKRGDTDDEFQAKCIAWLEDDSLFELGQALTTLVNEVNAIQPDRALAPEPLPDSADPKV